MIHNGFSITEMRERKRRRRERAEESKIVAF